jgi:hypothetical protein
MSQLTRAGQVRHLLRLIDACPAACRVVFHNPALPAGVVVHIPEDEPTPIADGGLQPTAAVGVPAPPRR